MSSCLGAAARVANSDFFAIRPGILLWKKVASFAARGAVARRSDGERPVRNGREADPGKGGRRGVLPPVRGERGTIYLEVDVPEEEIDTHVIGTARQICDTHRPHPWTSIFLVDFSRQAGRFRRLVGTMSPPDDASREAEIYVEGKRKMVDGFLRWCQKGDVGLSQVVKVIEVVDEEPTGLYDAFYAKVRDDSS